MRSLIDFLPLHRSSKKTAVLERSLYRTRSYSYGEMEEGIFRVAAGLRKKGMQPGDRLVLWGENSARWMITFYACVLERIVVVPVDASFSEEYARKIQSITEAKLICSDRQPEIWNEMLKAPVPTVAPTSSEWASDTLLEIIYTSGATGDPKGVMITHGNILSNLTPIYNETQKYKRYAIPFSPIGFVHLIPLSHLFGQIMGLFIPQMLDAFVVFTDPSPSSVIRAVKQSKSSTIICVPQELSLLHKHVEQRFPGPSWNSKGKGITGFFERWWKYRKMHRQFGWKFLAFIVGGASLPIQEEEFWNERGFPVIQGYGLTETAPSVTISHPFKGLKRGSVGKALPNVEVKISKDGEVMVRGPNVTPGYYRNESATQDLFSDGWLRTGDIGRFDEEGNLHLLGRKKEVIVTADGLNVFPQDVEAILLEDARMQDCAVVPKEQDGRSQAHAVFVLSSGVSKNQVEDIVSQANQKLESFQRIRSFSIWPDSELPRTSTGKLKRLAIAAAIQGNPILKQKPVSLADRILEGSQENARLNEDLGLTSLDRVELLVELERSGFAVEEASFSNARTVGDVTRLLHQPSSEGHVPKSNQKRWTQWFPFQWFRYVARYLLVFPALRLRVRVHTTGLENLGKATPPFLFVSNHQGFLDVPVILKALPNRMRSLLAPAMGTDRTTLEQQGAALFFNTYSLPTSSIGLRNALEITGQLVDSGYSPLVFPEGKMTVDGKMLPFRSGIGVIAAQINISVVPIVLKGVFEIWPTTARGPGKGIAEVYFGEPIDFSGKDPGEITRILESWYRKQIP